MIFFFGDVKVEETSSNMLAPDKGTVVFEVSSDKATPFAVTIEKRGEEYINTAKTLLSQKVDKPEKFNDFLLLKAEEVLKKKFGSS